MSQRPNWFDWMFNPFVLVFLLLLGMSLLLGACATTRSADEEYQRGLNKAFELGRQQ